MTENEIKPENTTEAGEVSHSSPLPCSQGVYILAEWDGESFNVHDSNRYMSFDFGLRAIRVLGPDFYLLEVSKGSSHWEDGCERTLRVVANYDSANNA